MSQKEEILKEALLLLPSEKSDIIEILKKNLLKLDKSNVKTMKYESESRIDAYSEMSKKFKFVDLTIKEFDHWILTLRDQQVTLGSLVLISKNKKIAYSELSSIENEEALKIISWVEEILKKIFKYDKINYLALMMVDPIFHYHIIPRYSEIKTFLNYDFKDYGYPNTPELAKTNDITLEEKKRIIGELKTWL